MQLIPKRKQMQSLQSGQYQFAPVIRLPHNEHGLVRHASDMLKNVILQLLRLKNQQQPIDYREYGETGEPHKKGEFAGDISTPMFIFIV